MNGSGRSRVMLGALGGVLACTGCASRRVSQMVEDKQYREAICAAVEGSSHHRARVSDALDEDTGLHLHVYDVSADELAPLLDEPERAASILEHAHLVRIMLQTNALPVDDLHLDIEVKDQQASAVAMPVGWEALAAVTGETPPGAEQYDTYVTGRNILRGVAAVLTVGVSLPFTRFRKRRVVRQPTTHEYEASMPVAASLMRTLTPARCEGKGLETSPAGPGLYCAGYFLFERNAAASWSLILSQGYVAKTWTEGTDSCRLRRTFSVNIGSPEQWTDRFGGAMQPSRALDRVALETIWERD